MPRSSIRLLAAAVAILVVGTTTIALTRHGTPFGLGRESGAPALAPPVPPTANQPVSPPPAAVGNGAARAASRQPARRTARAPVAGEGGAANAAGGSATAYPGAVSCPQSSVPSQSPYAWECTHADGTPVRWPTTTVRIWTEGLTDQQAAALHSAQVQWTQQVGVTLVPASSAANAQLVITEVATLDALPDLGSDVVEYAVTEVHQTSGYYDHATIRVANAPLDSDTWLDTLLHELGHVAGLAHVVDNMQIMRRVVGAPQTSYGDGDIAGLQTERPR